MLVSATARISPRHGARGDGLAHALQEIAASGKTRGVHRFTSARAPLCLNLGMVVKDKRATLYEPRGLATPVASGAVTP